MGCDCDSGYQDALDRLGTVLRDLATLRLRVEEVLADRGKAPGPTPEEAEKAEAEAEERQRQREEARLRARREAGKGDEVDEEDEAVLRDAWMNS